MVQSACFSNEYITNQCDKRYSSGENYNSNQAFTSHQENGSEENIPQVGMEERVKMIVMG